MLRWIILVLLALELPPCWNDNVSAPRAPEAAAASLRAARAPL
jgi:hypothetical protein